MHIRPATSADRDRCYAICVDTAADGSSAAASHRHPELLGDIYVGPYLALEPDHCYVIVDDAEQVVGYALGTPATSAFSSRAEASWWPAVRDRIAGISDSSPADADLLRLIAMPAFAPEDVIGAYPAHGHIDLLPSAQGRGLGRALMLRLEESLRAADAPAMHLGVSATNGRALAFYARLGFTEIARDDETVYVGRTLS